MAQYYKLDITLDAESLAVGVLSTKRVEVSLPQVGPQGPQGETGATGPANELTIGSVTTGAPGTQADATLTGEAPNQTLNLAIPRGDQGEVGPPGQTGNQGPAGPANTLAIGTVTTGAAGSSADATVTGDSPAQTLNLVIPRGDKGDQGDQGPAGTATTDASDLTTGTLADARLSSNVPLLDAANTYSANQTLDGTNNVAPNQTAASGSSLMTRDLVDNEFFRRANKYSEHEIYTFTTAMLTTIGGSATPQSLTGGVDAPGWVFRPNTTVASANGYQALFGPFLQLSNGSNRAVKNWTNRSALSLRHMHISSAGTIRYYWGPQASTWAGGALAVRGIGFEIVNNSVFATCHNGTTQTTAATGVAMSNQIFYGLHIESDGAGGVRWWVDGVEQTALTGGPTGNSGNSQYGFCAEAVNPDPAASTFVNIHYLRLASLN